MIGTSWGGALTTSYALKYGQHRLGANFTSMVEHINEYVEHIHLVREEALPPTAVKYMKKIEKAGDWDDPTYTKYVDVLNRGVVDRQQPPDITHSISTMDTPV